MLARPDTLRVLYDPVSYYRPWRAALPGLPARARTGLNEYLIRHYGLPGYAAAAPGQALLAQRLIDVWPHLHAVAYLVACAKLKSVLQGSRAYLSLPAPAHAFMRLGFSPAARQPGAPPDARALLAWGGAYLQAAAAQRLPAWLGGRLPLPFAGLDALAAGPGDATIDSDMSCIWSAISYAKNNSRFCDQVRA